MQSPAVNPTTTTTTSTPPAKRLVFDRRYGWVLDEWKEPSQEALSGGRGMFCILPLGKAFVKKASESINCVGSFALNVLERPNVLSPQVLKSAFSDQMQKIASSVKNSELVLIAPKTNDSTEKTFHSSDLSGKNSG